ncbi:hypothetical protein LF1_08100 [Rubripirellula obstinata]|uniref:Uncharacterized protein n=1 Tax=Rubripirellula obstinata TaxID=406547 RepID=A0A5B1CGH4_9BACT|nr:hypothetical protein [Rubripirellula obstinata]KAA1258294.1 hypothetical protein LF1_08100 [Rubripirellula obstinata]
MTKNQTIEDAYAAAHARAIQAAEAVRQMLEDQPTPTGDNAIGWDDVGTLRHYAARLEELIQTEDADE